MVACVYFTPIEIGNPAFACWGWARIDIPAALPERSRMATLEQQFAELHSAVQELIALLEEAEHGFWISYLRRGLRQIEENRLSGATYVLGCYGGEHTFSDLVIGEDLAVSEPLRYRNLNARLGHLRTRTFEAANAIAARRSW